MSLPEWKSHRRDIRLGVIAALTNAGVPPFPTVAKDRVFDSRQDPLIHSQGEDVMPVVTVYTDTHKRRPISSKEPPFSNTLDIIIEMTLGGVGNAIETDAEVEDALDCFEEQVLGALFDPTRPAALNFRKMIKGVMGADSMRLANSENASRLAMRDLIIPVEFDQRCKPLDVAFPQFRELWMCWHEVNGPEETRQAIDDTCDDIPTKPGVDRRAYFTP